MPVTAAENDPDDVCESVFGGAHSSDNLWTVDAVVVGNTDKIVDDAQSARASETHTPSPARTSFFGSDLRRPHFKNPFDSPTSPRFPPTSATSMTFASGGGAATVSEAASSLHSAHWSSTPGIGAVVSAADFCTSTSSIFSHGTSQPATAQTSVENSRPSSASVTCPRLFRKSTSRSRSNTAATSTSNSGGSIYAGSAESTSHLTAGVVAPPTSAAVAAPTSNAGAVADRESQQAASVAALRAKFQEKEAAKAAKYRAAELKAQQKEQRKQDRKLSIAVGGGSREGSGTGTPVASPPSSPRFYRRTPSSPQSAQETWSNNSDNAPVAVPAAAAMAVAESKRDSLPADIHRKSSCALHPFKKEFILPSAGTSAVLSPIQRRRREGDSRTSSVSSSSTIASATASRASAATGPNSPLVTTAFPRELDSPASYTRPVLPKFTSTSASRPSLPVFSSGSTKATKTNTPAAAGAAAIAAGSEKQGRQGRRSTLRRVLAAIGRFFRLLGGRKAKGKKIEAATSTAEKRESERAGVVV